MIRMTVPHPIWRAALITPMLIWLGGCASLQERVDSVLDDIKPEKTVVTPQGEALTAPEFVAAPAPAFTPDRLPQSNWVASFNDPRLSQIVDEALAANPNIELARARLDASKAASMRSRAGLLPTVTGSFRGSHSENGNPQLGNFDSVSAGVDVGWEPDLWGRIRDGVDAAELDVTATEADLSGARLSIVGNASIAWFDLIEARLQVELAERNVATQQRALDLTERRFRRGVANSADVRLARSSLASAEANLATRRQQRDATARRVEILLRRYPSAELEAATDLPALPPLPELGTPEDLLIYRPDLIAAETRMYAQGLNVDIARKALLPGLRFSSDQSLSTQKISELLDFDNFVWTLGFGLTAPIFQGGALKADIARQEAILRQQMASYTDTVLNAYLEVENALDADRRLAEREAALRVSLEEAEQARNRLERQYAQGLSNFLPLLDAQARVFQAEGALISARRERLTNRVRLHMALGGGLYGAPPSATTPALAQ